MPVCFLWGCLKDLEGRCIHCENGDYKNVKVPVSNERERNKMSEKFTASNGIEVHKKAKLGINLQKDGKGNWVHEPYLSALREFILQEEGLWKDPETGEIVYRMPENDDADGRAVQVLGAGGTSWEKITMSETARNYFKAHPVSKPWHDAKEGEIWEVKMKLPETKPEPRAVMRRDDGTGSFVDPQARKPSIPLDSSFIREARRIWPVDSEE